MGGNPGKSRRFLESPCLVTRFEFLSQQEPLVEGKAIQHQQGDLRELLSISLERHEAGNLVDHGFCGSGMTGVATQFCALPPAEYRSELDDRWAKAGLGRPKWGSRKVILNDLSPAATFIAANYTTPFDVNAFAEKARQLLDDAKADIGWMYQTLHSDGRTHAQIEYTVWSEVYSCCECSGEVVFLTEALDRKTNKVRETFPCPNCKVVLTKSRLEQLFEKRFDKLLQQSVEAPKRKPVLLVYKIGKTRYEKEPTAADLALLRKIDTLEPPHFPVKAFPFDDMWEATRLFGRQITHVHHLFLPRQVHALCAIWMKALNCQDARIREFMIFFVEQAIWGMSVLARYAPTHFSQVIQQDRFGSDALSSVGCVTALFFSSCGHVWTDHWAAFIERIWISPHCRSETKG